MKRAALYGRVSTKDKGQEVENQSRDIRDLIKKEQWTLFRSYDDYETGARGDRAAFLQMMRDAEAKKFDVLVFWSLDRLTREGALKTLQYLQRLTDLGIGWRSYTEPYLDSCGVFRDAVISILATIAKQERIRMSERTKAGMARARAAGSRIGRPSVELRPDVNAAQVARLRKQGRSWEKIAKHMGISRNSARRIASRGVQKGFAVSVPATTQIQ
jgi:DNA invertase Pin-like site-specific DNA recombinase